MSGGKPLLEVRDLKKHFPMTRGVMKEEIGRVRAVDGISFEVREGETFGIVGESGCGKSTAARTILRLAEPTDGSVYFDGNDIVEYNRKELKRFRRDAQMIFQDPDSSFDPRMSVGESLAEPLIVHGLRDREKRRAIIKKLLVRVGLQPDDIDRYPHEFSGGQKQRIGLARALILNPRMLVADEPVSALDMSIQAEILGLMEELQEEFGLSIVLISHNLGVVRHICDRVGVMYLGELVEVRPTEELFTDPKHPYTRALISAIPSTNLDDRGQRVRLTGDVPDPANPPRGCRFHTRCPEVIPPEGYSLEQRTWRSLLDFKQRVENEKLTVEYLYELLHPESTVEEDDVPERVAPSEIEPVLRDEYELDERLEDSSADDVFTEAVEHLAGGNLETAKEFLETEFSTVCQTSKPAVVEEQAGHRNACHLTEVAEHRQETVPTD